MQWIWAQPRFLVGFFTVAFFAQPSAARVFDMGKETFGSYLRSSYTSGVPGTDPFADSSGSNLTFDGRHRYLTTYEFGFLFARRYLNFRTGFEIIQPPEQKGIHGSNTAGTQLYSLDSAVSGLIIKGGFEGNLRTWRRARFSLYAEGGYASVTIQNTLAFNSSGTTAYGLADFREEVKGTSLALAGGFLYEFLLSDSTTLFFEGGYRSLQFGTLNHSVASTGFQGAASVGTRATTNTGTYRSLNLSGPVIAAGLRFWIF